MRIPALSSHAAIPRLPKWRTAPADAVESRLAELESTLALAGRGTTNEEDRNIVEAVSQCSLVLADGADGKAKVG